MYGETTNDDSDNDLFIDNFNVSDIPTCPPPSTIVISNNSTNSADVNWVENGTATLWNLEYGVTGFTLGSGTAINNLNATTAQITSLNDSTSYDVYVRSDCGGGDASTWTGPVSFTTDCLAVTNFNEDFENVNEPDLPLCWSSLVPMGASTPPAVETSFNNTDANTEIRMYQGSSTSGDIILVLPEMSNLTSGTHELLFDARSPITATQDIIVGTLADPTDASTFIALATKDVSTTYQSFTQDFSSYTGTDRYVGLKRIATSTFTSVNIDNVIWRTIPTCKAPVSLDIRNVSDTAADLSWTSGGSGEGNWNVEYGISGFTVGNGTIVSVTTPSFNITNLEAATAYDVYVTAVCSPTDQSDSTLISFTTSCGALSDLDENFESVSLGTIPNCWTALKPGTDFFADFNVRNINGGKVINMNNSGSSSGSMVLVTPFLTTISAGNYRLELEAQATSASQDLIVGTMSNPSDVSSFTAFSTLDLSTGYQNFTVDFSSYSGTDKYIGFSRVMTQAFTQVNIDNIVWEVIPTCVAPPQVAVNQELTTAQVSWVSGGSGETQWELQYGPSGFTLGTGTSLISTTISQTISNLTENTIYDVYVRAICNPGDLSKWSDVTSFTTLIDYCGIGVVSNNTSNNGSNVYTICPSTPGETVILDFSKLNLQSAGGNGCVEYLRIYDGKDTSATFFRTPSGNNQFCFDDEGGTYNLKNRVIAATNPSGCVTIELKTFSSLTAAQGFIANIYCTATPYLWDGDSWRNNPEGNITDADRLYIVKGNSSPSLSSSIAVNSIFTEEGAILSSTTGSVMINGELINHGKLAGTQAYILRSTNGQSITGNGSIDHLEIDNSAGVTINNSHGINKSLTLTSGVFTTNDALTMKSSAQGTGMINKILGTGTISGEVVVERFIPSGNRAYRFIGSTVGGQSVYDGWQESGTNDNGFGTHITGLIGVPNTIDATTGLDLTTSGNPSLYEWDQINSRWGAILDTQNELFETGKFLRVLVRGDRITNLSFNSSEHSTATLRSKGILTTGPKTLNGTSTAGFMALANPYQSRVDMNLTVKNNLAGDMYYWDPTVNMRGAYTTIEISSGTGTVGSAGKILEPGQGVFLQQTGAGMSTVLFEESDKVSGSENLGVLSTSNASQYLKLSLFDTTAFSSGDKAMDGLIMKFDPTENLAVDLNDAIKFGNLDENMAISHSDGSLLAIERRPLPMADEVVNLDITRFRNTNYTFATTLDDLPTVRAYIKDRFTNTMTEIVPGNGNTYTTVDFTIDTSNPATYAPDRFQLVFEMKTLGLETATTDKFTMYPNPIASDVLKIRLGNINDSDSVDYKIYNSLGQLVKSKNLIHDGSGILTISGISELNNGIYLVQITNGNLNYTGRMVVNR